VELNRETRKDIQRVKEEIYKRTAKELVLAALNLDKKNKNGC